jgi:hypothetical protein
MTSAEASSDNGTSNVIEDFLNRNSEAFLMATNSPYAPVRLLATGAVIVGSQAADLVEESPLARKAAEGVAVAALVGYGALRTAIEIAPKYASEIAETGLRNIQQ